MNESRKEGRTHHAALYRTESDRTEVQFGIEQPVQIHRQFAELRWLRLSRLDRLGDCVKTAGKRKHSPAELLRQQIDR